MHTDALAQQPHEAVTNQATPLENYNLFASDTPLREAVAREGAAWGVEQLDAFGAELGTPETLHLGALANTNEPVLHRYDRFGARVDWVEFHPAYHELMALGVSQGMHASVWSDPKPGAHVHRAALMHLRHQVEQGTSCPLTMTFAVVPSLRVQPDVADAWLPKVLSRTYDPAHKPISEKRGATFGMAMTERQGGSDVRANSSRATPVGAGGPGAEYLLEGHKWFCSAPMCDAFLVLAQTEQGLGCFLVPRWRDDGSLNPMRFERLKEKLGNRSNASSEVRFEKCVGWLIGEPGRGVATIIEMVRHTRLDCVIGASSLIRRCVAEAIHHASGRWAFGKPIVTQPLMKNVLADLALESEAATATAFRLARAFDEAADSPAAALFSRIGTPVSKYWTTKRETVVAREALECLGGNGFVEASPMPRLFRESPLNSIWEGAGNVQCLDVLRAMRREPEVVHALWSEIGEAAGSSRAFDDAFDAAQRAFDDPKTVEVRARRIVEQLALLLQSSLLVRSAPNEVSDAFVRSRLGGDSGGALGTLPADVDFDTIIARSAPVLH